MYCPRFERSKPLRTIERNSEQISKNCDIVRYNNDKASRSMKRVSDNKFEIIKKRPRSKVRFDLNKQEDMPRAIQRKSTKTPKTPKGILKFKKEDSSEVSEADEISPFEKTIHIYKSSTKASSDFSSGKELPRIENQSIFEKLFGFSP